MDKAQKLAHIANFESAVDPLLAFVRALPPAAVDFRPALPEAWTIREHAVHFVDADAFAHGRARLTVAEPGAEVYVWDEEAWQAKLRYDTGDALAALECCRGLRHITCAMARAVVDADWESFYVRHPKRGRMTLADILSFYVDHAQFHLNYFQRNLDAFKASAR